MNKYGAILLATAFAVSGSIAAESADDSQIEDMQDAQHEAQMDDSMQAGAEISDHDFTDMDQNEDGYLNPQEALKNNQLVNNWQDADLDADGRISSQEYTVYAGEATAAGQPATDMGSEIEQEANELEMEMEQEADELEQDMEDLGEEIETQ